MSRAGPRGGSAGHGKGPAPEEGAQEMVPLSLQKLRELADSLRASMPVDDAGEDKSGSPTPNKINARRKKQEKGKRRPGAQDTNTTAYLTEQTDLQQHVDSMRDKYQSLCDEHQKMISEGKKAQQAYIRREVQYKSQIARMEELLNKAELSRGGDDVGMPNAHARDASQRLGKERDRIRELHGKILERLSEMQAGTRSVIAAHEKEMLQVFRSRLFEVEDKVKKSNAKKSGDVVGGVPRSWALKANRLARELEHYKEESIRLDGENERLTKESNRLQAEHKSHLDDLAYLENQMTSLKKENLRLKKELEDTATVSMRKFLSSAQQAISLSPADEADEQESTGGETVRSGAESEGERERQTLRLMEAVGRLRRLIDQERARLREVRTGHVSALASRTELENFLRDALADVKRQISKHRLEAMEGIAASMQGDMLKEERDKVLELLLSQERVITLLYDKTFPVKSALTSYGGPRALSRAGREPEGDDAAAAADALLHILPDLPASPEGGATEQSDHSFLHDPSWEALGKGAAGAGKASHTSRSSASQSPRSPPS